MATKEQKSYYKNNRLQQLRGFSYAAQFGNITKAAAHMGLTQSTVSLQIKSLEDELGVRLFKRHGPQISLTREGEELLKLSAAHLDGIQNIFDVFHQKMIEGEKTELNIAVNATVKSYIMPRLLNDYIEKYPETYVTLHFAEQEKAIEMLEEEEIDLAVLPRRDHAPLPYSCVYKPLFFYKSCLITRHDHPLAGRQNLSVEEISRYNVILPGYDYRVIPNLYDIFSRYKIDKKRRINFVDMETGREYLEAGLVITVSSNVFVSPDDPILTATPLPHLFDDVDYGFVTRRDEALPEKIKNLMRLAQKKL